MKAHRVLMEMAGFVASDLDQIGCLGDTVLEIAGGCGKHRANVRFNTHE